MLEVVDGEARDDRVEGAHQVGQGFREIVLDHPDRPITRKAYPGLLEHGR